MGLVGLSSRGLSKGLTLQIELFICNQLTPPDLPKGEELSL